MDENLKNQLSEIKQLKGEKKQEELLSFARKYNSPQAYNELGVYYKEKEDYPKAIEAFREALSITEDSTVYVNLAGCYYLLSKPNTPKRQYYMDRTVEAFEASAKLNSASYFFLGNLYLPKSNPPFPDDYLKANSYFMKIEKDKKYFWANGMKSIATYYYKEKEDYVTASAFMYLAKNADPSDKKMANYYEIVFGKCPKRKFWEERFKLIGDQNDVQRVIAEGLKSFEIKCPACGSTNCRKLNVIEHSKKMLQVTFGIKRLEKYAKKYKCMKCNFEW